MWVQCNENKSAVLINLCARLSLTYLFSTYIISTVIENIKLHLFIR